MKLSRRLFRENALKPKRQKVFLIRKNNFNFHFFKLPFKPKKFQCIDNYEHFLGVLWNTLASGIFQEKKVFYNLYLQIRTCSSFITCSYFRTSKQHFTNSFMSTCCLLLLLQQHLGMA